MLRPAASNSLYGATKAALTFATRAWAAELAGEAIRVKCLMPGAVDTEMLRQAVSPNEVAAPLGRLVSPGDVVACVAWLVSAEMVTGAAITLDGGTSL